MTGVDKLLLLATTIEEPFYTLARGEGERRYRYKHVLDLSKTDHRLPVVLHCDGIRNGIHKIEVQAVARLGLTRTREILKPLLGKLSRAWIYRVDFCTDLLGVSVWEMAAACSVRQVQNYRIFRKRGAVSFYLQCSANRTLVLYDKARELAAKGSPWVGKLRRNDELTRVEVQLRGAAVPYKKIRHLDRYADVELLAGLEFRRLKTVSADAKPLHLLAAAYLRDQIAQYGLQAVRKRFGSAQWPYIERIFFDNVRPHRIPNVRRRLRKSIEDWLEDRVRFPRLPTTRSSDDQE
jgi:hypothetical protein